MIDFFDDIGDLIFGNKRLDELKHFARSKGFQMKRKVKTTGLHLDIQGMNFFEGKKRKTIKGYLYKKDNEYNSLNQIFDYYYAGDLGTYTTSIFLYNCTALSLPQFNIKPKGSLSKLGNIFSWTEWSDVNRNFDKDYVIESKDMNYMRMMITTQFTDVMLRLGDFTLEGKGDYLVLYKKHTKADIVDMDNIYDYGLEILDIILNDHSNEMV